MPFVSILPTMKTKDKKFQLRLKKHERDALHKLADREGISAANYLLNYIRAETEKTGERK